jgi:hypothetical protein
MKIYFNCSVPPGERKGATNFCSWYRLVNDAAPALCNLQKGERVDSVEIDEDGIHFNIVDE